MYAVELLSVSVGAAGVCVRGTGSVWGSSGQRQPSPLPLPNSQHTFLKAHQSSGPSAIWSHRYNMHMFINPNLLACIIDLLLLIEKLYYQLIEKTIFR